MPDLRIGVVGVAGRGLLAKKAHKPNEGSRVVACCDVDPDELAKCLPIYTVNGIPPLRTDDINVLLSANLDAIFICSPDYVHERQAIAALSAGAAVYLEKPLAITTAGCDAVLATAARLGGKLFLGHNMRHMTFVKEMRSVIESGVIGNVKSATVRHFVGQGGDYYFKDWHADRRNVCSLLLQKACHDLDVVAYLCGGHAVRVNAMGKLAVYGACARREGPVGPARASGAVAASSPNNWPPESQTDLWPVVDVEDVSILQAELTTGALVSYMQNHFAPVYWRNYLIIGTKGMIENCGDVGEGAVVKVWTKRTTGFGEPDRIIAVGGDAANHGGSDERIVDDFLKFVRGEGRPAGATPLDARAAVATGYAATQSLRTGGNCVEIPPLDPEVALYWA